MCAKARLRVRQLGGDLYDRAISQENVAAVQTHQAHIDPRSFSRHPYFPHVSWGSSYTTHKIILKL